MSATAVSTTPSRADCADLLRRFGVPETAFSTGGLVVRSPINGAEIARLQASSRGDVERVVGATHAAFLAWRSIPAPRRGELVRLFADAFRAHNAALVCRNSIVWKPSEKTPLTALACQALLERVMAGLPEAQQGISAVIVGEAEIGEALVEDRRVRLVSATGSTRMGRAVAPRIAARFGRAILELGGNNGMIVAPSADLDLATRAILFAAAGTAGQRCTTLRRLFAHESIYPQLVARLKQAYAQVAIGNPLEPGTLVGPLIDRRAFEAMQSSLAEARREGGAVTGGERVHGNLW